MNITLLYAIATIRNFVENECLGKTTSVIVVKKDGTLLKTDWGYFLDGLNEIERWAKNG